MPEFARSIRALEARSGLWFRPLLASPAHPQYWRLARDPKTLDPTVPEVCAYLRKTIRLFDAWGFELIKYDYSTYDLLGRWEMKMQTGMAADGWAFADRSRSTAEVTRGPSMLAARNLDWATFYGNQTNRGRRLLAVMSEGSTLRHGARLLGLSDSGIQLEI
jgi:hypothetical protein